VLINPNSPAGSIEPQVRDLELAAKALGLRLRVLKVADEFDAGAAFATFVGERVDAVFVTVDAIFNSQLRDPLVALAARHRLPTMFPWRDHVAVGGLVCYTSSVLMPGGRPAPMPGAFSKAPMAMTDQEVLARRKVD
jgi:putative tryptophan/tyrosine transport system substrate-binding protein